MLSLSLLPLARNLGRDYCLGSSSTPCLTCLGALVPPLFVVVVRVYMLGTIRHSNCRWVWLSGGRRGQRRGGRRAWNVSFVFESNHATEETQADAPSFYILSGRSLPTWAVLPPMLSVRAQRARLLCHLGEGTGARRRRRRQRRDATDCQSAIEFVVQGSYVAANQQTWNCKQVSFRWWACPAAHPRSLRPPLQSRCFTSFPPVSRRSLSFLERSPFDPRRFSALRRLRRVRANLAMSKDYP